MTKTTIKVFSEGQSLSHFGAELFDQITRDAISLRGRFFCALSGGGTPMALYSLLAQSPYRESLPWEKMSFFWGDERCVPPDDPGSNYFQARQALLGQVSVLETNIFRARGELIPQLAAADYALQLSSRAEPGLDWPRFDMVLLGLGADGHTASLFPGSQETHGIPTVAVTANYQERPANRVSVTPDVINSARNVVFLVTGGEKADALVATVTGAREPVRLPAQRILPVDGRLWWLVDQAAASRLPESIDGIEIQRV